MCLSMLYNNAILSHAFTSDASRACGGMPQRKGDWHMRISAQWPTPPEAASRRTTSRRVICNVPWRDRPGIWRLLKPEARPIIRVRIIRCWRSYFAFLFFWDARFILGWRATPGAPRRQREYQPPRMCERQDAGLLECHAEISPYSNPKPNCGQPAPAGRSSQ